MRCTRCDQTASAVCVLSFGYFSLHKQRKVTGCRATPDGFDCELELNLELESKLKTKVKKTDDINHRFLKTPSALKPY